ncbi:MAG: hypothetical protein HDT23_09125 [Ruminococcus sp.]|nr:hypothetical protein [Ruminococcus sp.]
MSYYVFSCARCTCTNGGQGVLNASIADNNTTFNGRHIITINKEPAMTGPCATIKVCNPAWVGNWINTELCVTSACGTPVILNTSIKICAYGGIVKIADPNNNVVMNTGISDVTLDKNLKKDIDNQINTYNQETTDEQKKMSDKAYADVFGALGEVYAKFEDKNKSIMEKTGDTEPEPPKKSESSAKLYNPSEDGICSGKCPPEYAETCTLKKSVPSDTILLDNENNSGKLKKNMNKELPPEDDETISRIKKISSSLSDKVECTEAYHHLIPGNQCMNKNKFLVTLANLYGYDINNPNNAVCLPMLKKVDKNITEEEWLKAKYDVIRGTGRQLHLGGHSYNLDTNGKEEYIREDAVANIKTTRADNYEATVLANLNDRVADVLKDKLSNSCRMNLSEEQKQKEKEDFQELMDDLSQAIKEAILDYPTEMAYTENYYVSKDAMAYDKSKTKSFDEFKKLTKG